MCIAAYFGEVCTMAHKLFEDALLGDVHHVGTNSDHVTILLHKLWHHEVTKTSFAIPETPSVGELGDPWTWNRTETRLEGIPTQLINTDGGQ